MPSVSVRLPCRRRGRRVSWVCVSCRLVPHPCPFVHCHNARSKEWQCEVGGVCVKVTNERGPFSPFGSLGCHQQINSRISWRCILDLGYDVPATHVLPKPRVSSIVFLSYSEHMSCRARVAEMEAPFEFDLTYITERIIATTLPPGIPEHAHQSSLRDIAGMLTSKHADKYLIINLSGRRNEMLQLNPQVLDFGWPSRHAPHLDTLCSICKAIDSWLNSHPLHVAVLHCAGNSGSAGVVIAAFMHYSAICASADQALDRFAMKRFYVEKFASLTQPSQQRYVYYFNGLLSGSIKMNSAPVYLSHILLHGAWGPPGGRVFLRVYQGLHLYYTSPVYTVRAEVRDGAPLCMSLSPGVVLKGDILVKCYRSSEDGRVVVFRVQFHTCTLQGNRLKFTKHDLDEACADPGFPDSGQVELLFSSGPVHDVGKGDVPPGITVDCSSSDPILRWVSYGDLHAQLTNGEHTHIDLHLIAYSGERFPGGEASPELSLFTHSAPTATTHPTLSVSSDSGHSTASSTSPSEFTAAGRSGEPGPPAPSVPSGPSASEQRDLDELLRGFSLDGGDPGGGLNDRETDILDDELLPPHDLRSVDSLGTLSSLEGGTLSPPGAGPGGEGLGGDGGPAAGRYGFLPEPHKVSQCSLLSDSTGYNTVEEPQQDTPCPTHSWVQQQSMYANAGVNANAGPGGSAGNIIYSEPGGDSGAPAVPHTPARGSSSRHAVQRGVGSWSSHGGGGQLAATLRGGDSPAPPLSALRIEGRQNDHGQRESPSSGADGPPLSPSQQDLELSLETLNQLILDLDPTFTPVPTCTPLSTLRRQTPTPLGSRASEAGCHPEHVRLQWPAPGSEDEPDFGNGGRDFGNARNASSTGGSYKSPASITGSAGSSVGVGMPGFSEPPAREAGGRAKPGETGSVGSATFPGRGISTMEARGRPVHRRNLSNGRYDNQDGEQGADGLNGSAGEQNIYRATVRSPVRAISPEVRNIIAANPGGRPRERHMHSYKEAFEEMDQDPGSPPPRSPEARSPIGLAETPLSALKLKPHKPMEIHVSSAQGKATHDREINARSSRSRRTLSEPWSYVETVARNAEADAASAGQRASPYHSSHAEPYAAASCGEPRPDPAAFWSSQRRGPAAGATPRDNGANAQYPAHPDGPVGLLAISGAQQAGAYSGYAGVQDSRARPEQARQHGPALGPVPPSPRLVARGVHTSTPQDDYRRQLAPLSGRESGGSGRSSVNSALSYGAATPCASQSLAYEAATTPPASTYSLNYSTFSTTSYGPSGEQQPFGMSGAAASAHATQTRLPRGSNDEGRPGEASPPRVFPGWDEGGSPEGRGGSGSGGRSAMRLSPGNVNGKLSTSPLSSGLSSPGGSSTHSAAAFPHSLPDWSPTHGSPVSPDGNLESRVNFVQDTSKYWYKPDISRDQAITMLKGRDPGAFVIRDSSSFRGAYGLALKVATPPGPSLDSKKGDPASELVRHFLIESTPKGVRLKGCTNEPVFGDLSAFVYQHSITPLALPCKLLVPEHDPLDTSSVNSASELLKQGAACNVLFLGSVEMESLTGPQAIGKATAEILDMKPRPVATTVHFKVSAQGITLTDNQRRLFFRRHYPVSTVTFCNVDPETRTVFGFVARKPGSSTDNLCHLFAELDPEQPAAAIVNFVSKVLLTSQKR
ncbi:unnamed protein product [Lampetra fluviatilis]